MFISRDLLTDIRQWLDREKILILKGSRQVGKTTLLKFLEQELKKEHPTLFFSIDLEMGNPLFKEPKLFIKFLESHVVRGKRLYVFLDEFQYVENPGLFVKVVFDRLKEQIQLIISGSSSLEISRSKEFLTGRKIEFQLMPFSFKEYAGIAGNIKNIGNNHYLHLDRLEEIRDFYLINRDNLITAVIDYLNWGGYPEPCFESGEKKSIILREIISTYLQKDIAGFLKISKLDAYNNLLRLMASQIGNLVNKNEISKTLGLNMETVNKYLNILEGTYVFFLLSPYFTNIRKEISKMQKVYISDPGLRRFILNSALHHTPDSFQGNEIENFVYIHTAQLKSVSSINYYRTISKAEIDFILHCRGAMIPLEVKYRKGPLPIPSVFKNFSGRYPDKVSRTLIITRDYLHQEGNHYFIPYLVFPFMQL
jgi:predicted AAA+ superfamily ATPase